jgi:hypothetical protein
MPQHESHEGPHEAAHTEYSAAYVGRADLSYGVWAAAVAGRQRRRDQQQQHVLRLGAAHVSGTSSTPATRAKFLSKVKTGNAPASLDDS